MILEGDCVEKMRELDEASVDAIVCDPPYGLGFMGKDWDTAARMASVPPSGTPDTPLGRFNTGKGQGAVTFEATAFQAWCVEWATEALRILKPGGYLLAFGGTRTYHRLACAVEDAGFEIRDSLIWLYGSGFPKSLDVSKAIDKAAGAEREVVGSKDVSRMLPNDVPFGEGLMAGNVEAGTVDVTAPATPEAAQWEGFGTSLKPAHEPVVVARKPLVGTVAANVLEHGTGALNVDGCRVEGEPHSGGAGMASSGRTLNQFAEYEPGPNVSGNPAGRWPPNVVLSHLSECNKREEIDDGYNSVPRTNRGDQSTPENAICSRESGDRRSCDEAFTKSGSGVVQGSDSLRDDEVNGCAPGCPIAELDEQSGERGGSGRASGPTVNRLGDNGIYGHADGDRDEPPFYGDSGGPSRFFYQAKASRAERNAGLDGFEQVAEGPAVEGFKDGSLHAVNVTRKDKGPSERKPTANVHPTVKPIDLMRWLVRLVTPPGGTVLDPFTGSGTTGIAAVLEGFDFLGIEREPEYVEIAKARIAWWEQQSGDTAEILIRAGLSERIEREHREAGQLAFAALPPDEGSSDA